MNRPLPLAALVPLLLAACGTTAPATPIPGLRTATVVQVGDAASFGPLRDNDCRVDAAADPRIAQRYASVRYFSGRHAHLRIVPVGDDFDGVAGDPVRLKPGSCRDALSR